MGGRRKSKIIPEVLALIKQQPDESIEEFKRRYNREKRRAYRALIPKGPRRFRGPDKTLRKNASPPEVRAALIALPGESEEDRKRRYQRLNVKYWRARNKEHADELRRQNQRSPQYRATRAEWIARNPEKAAASQAKYLAANRDKRLAALDRWRKENPEKVKKYQREWFAARPGYLAAYASKYRENAVRATPPWMWKLYGKEIDAIYRRCARTSEQTGIPHHVDHIYPLAGKTSCGLHVPWNLQIIPATVNGRKRNKSPEEFNIQELQNDQA